MRQILGIYRLIKVTDKTAQKGEKPSDGNAGRYIIGRPYSSEVITRFNKRYPKVSDRDLRLSLGLAITGGYLIEKKLKEQLGTFEIDVLVLEIRDKGWRLLDTPPLLPFVPVGLWNELLNEYGNLVKVLVGFVAGIFGAEVVKAAARFTSDFLMHHTR